MSTDERERWETEARKAYDALNSSVSGVIITDTQGRITYTNPAFLSMFGYRHAQEVVGKDADLLFVRDDICEISDVSNAIEESGQKTREFEVNRKDGSSFFVEASSSDIHGRNGHLLGAMASFVDISRRKKKEQEAEQYQALLRVAAKRAEEAEERERRRISAFIHDTIVQSLSLSNIRLGAVGSALKAAGAASEATELTSARELIADGIRQCRLVMGELTPSLLYEVGLSAALKGLVAALREQHGAVLNFEEDEKLEPVPKPWLGMLYRSTRELLMNALKHASDGEIKVAVSRQGDQVCIEVKDQGPGFDPAIIDQLQGDGSHGFGLFSVRERLRDLRGRLDIHSKDGDGTTIRIVAPVFAQGGESSPSERAPAPGRT
jgi:PAS domain S-box-containing protein